jgi:hypothetical protein
MDHATRCCFGVTWGMQLQTLLVCPWHRNFVGLPWFPYGSTDLQGNLTPFGNVEETMERGQNYRQMGG